MGRPVISRGNAGSTSRIGPVGFAILILLVLAFSTGEASGARIAGALPGPAAVPDEATPAGASITNAVTGPGEAKASPKAWTRQEMLDARPVPPGGIAAADQGRPGGASTSASTGGTSPMPSAGGPVTAEAIADAGSPRYRTNGKLFFEMGGEPWVCSGTVVESKRRNVVMTAGHCVYDQVTEGGEGEWARNIVFVPAYSGETAPEGSDAIGPYGQYPAAPAGLTAPKGWVEKRLQNYDLGAVALDRQIELDVGASKIDFRADLTRRGLEILGYPAAPEPLDGRRLTRCVPASVGFDWSRVDGPVPFEAAPCRMWQGASGGGWIAGGRFLVSVISYGYCSKTACGSGLYGPSLGDAAINLYNNDAIGGSAPPSLRLVKRPPRKTRKRAIKVRVDGDGTTPLVFRVKLGRGKPVFTNRVIRIRKLSVGRHALRIRSVDQTGRLSRRTILKKFRVLPKKKKKRKTRTASRGRSHVSGHR